LSSPPHPVKESYSVPFLHQLFYVACISERDFHSLSWSITNKLSQEKLENLRRQMSIYLLILIKWLYLMGHTLTIQTVYKNTVKTKKYGT